jgi:hypothetical protein
MDDEQENHRGRARGFAEKKQKDVKDPWNGFSGGITNSSGVVMFTAQLSSRLR